MIILNQGLYFIVLHVKFSISSVLHPVPFSPYHLHRNSIQRMQACQVQTCNKRKTCTSKLSCECQVHCSKKIIIQHKQDSLSVYAIINASQPNDAPLLSSINYRLQRQCYHSFIFRISRSGRACGSNDSVETERVSLECKVHQTIICSTQFLHACIKCVCTNSSTVSMGV